MKSDVPRLLRRALAGVTMAMAATAASGIEIISNLPGNDATQSFGLTNLRIKAMGFTMPSGPAYTLDDVILRLNVTNVLATPIIEIWSDDFGNPFQHIATLNGPVFQFTGIANYTYTPAGPVTLDGGTGYWIIAYAPAGSPGYDWKASSPAQIPVGIATHLGSKFVSNGILPPLTNSVTLTSYAVNASEVSAGCRPDLTTTAIPGSAGYGVPNGVLNNDDFFYYLAQFAAGNLAVADMTTTAIPGSPGYGVPNGILNNDDFFFYLAIFAAGC